MPGPNACGLTEPCSITAATRSFGVKAGDGSGYGLRGWSQGEGVRRGLVASGLAPEQFNPKRSLKRRNSPGAGGLVDPERSGGALRRAVLQDGEEIAEIVPVGFHGLHFCSRSCAIGGSLSSGDALKIATGRRRP